jgi:hypothetical protein
MLATDASDHVSLSTGLVRFDGRFANRVQNPVEVPKFLQKLHERLRQIDPEFQMGDKDGNVMSMDAIPDTFDGCKDKFNLQVITKRDHQHLMFVVSLSSTKTLGILKKAAMTWLQRNSLYMNRHALAASTLDVGKAGFILGANPRFHSPSQQKELMMTEIQAWWTSAAPEARRNWNGRLTADSEDKLQVPPFFVNARANKGRNSEGMNVQEAAFLIMVPTQQINLLTDLLEEVFHPTKTTADTSIQFIPTRLQAADPDTYYKLIQQQGHYLKDFQNVGIAGIHREIMLSQIALKDPKGTNATVTVHQALLLHPAIHRVDPGSYVIPLGKWNVSTDQEQAAAAREWIDHVIQAIPDWKRRNTGFADFPTITRMQAPTKRNQSEYVQWVKTVTPSQAKNRNQSTTSGTAASTRRSFSQNPQEPDVPPLLRFQARTNGPANSYLQAAGRTQTQTSTPISSISQDQIRGYENEMQSMRSALGKIQEKQATLETHQKTPANPSAPDDDTDSRKPEATDSSLQLIQEVLREMRQNHNTSQARFDAMEDSSQGRFNNLEDQQHGVASQVQEMTSTVASLNRDNIQLRETNLEIMERLQQLEGTAPSTSASPVRKKRSDGASFTDDETMTETPTQPGDDSGQSPVSPP